MNPSGPDICQNCGATISTDSSDLESRVHTLLDQGLKIEAIKLYREATGAGLKEAKDAVENLEYLGKLPIQDFPGLEAEINDLLEQGQKIAAIKHYRDKTGAGLKEARDAVEALSSKYQISSKASGCAGLVALVVAGLAMVGSRAW
jgi:ribosomal protein L7/L12